MHPLAHAHPTKETFLVSQLTTWPFVSLTLTRLEPGHRFTATSPPDGAGVDAEGGCSASMFAFLTRDTSIWLDIRFDPRIDLG